jgi:RHS repeat-associated protein
VVDYTYEPYGRTTADATNGNTQQYTGRENDNPGNAGGLYYYRARYHMPGCARFISEDPIGWASGQTNNYSYVGGDPVSNTDPTGNFGIVGAGIGAGLDVALQLARNGGNAGCIDWTSVGLSAVAGALTGGLANGNFAWKAGSNTWGATRKWLGKPDVWDLAKGQHVHHGIIERNGTIGKLLPDSIKNQPWNLRPMSEAGHQFIHNRLDPVTRKIVGAPSYAQGAAAGIGVAVAGGGGSGCD